jgi:predicted dehydrogenase
MSFNWCFIGTGKIANKVAKELVTNPGHKIVSVFNRTKEKAENFALNYHAKVYDSAFEAINDPRVDGVYIATTNETHFEYCKLCLYNNIPVLCEKPITGNALELKELIRISKASNTFLKEAMWTWFNPVANKVKEWIKEERIGKILSVECIFNVPIFGYNKAKGRYISPARYGGALLDLGVYCVRYVYELFGKPQSIKAKGKLYNGIDVWNESIFDYGDFKAKVSSQINALVGEHCIIKGEKGTIKVPFFHMASKAVLKTKDGKEVFKDKNKKFATQFRKVAEYIKKETPDELVSLDSSLGVMELMDEIRKQIGVKFPCD